MYESQNGRDFTSGQGKVMLAVKFHQFFFSPLKDYFMSLRYSQIMI